MLSVLFCSVWRRMFCTLEAVSRNALSKVNKVWNVSSSFPCFSQFLMKNDGFQHRLGTTARKRSKQWAFRAGVLLRDGCSDVYGLDCSLRLCRRRRGYLE
jgi:hypothetical protein